MREDDFCGVLQRVGVPSDISGCEPHTTDMFTPANNSLCVYIYIYTHVYECVFVFIKRK